MKNKNINHSTEEKPVSVDAALALAFGNTDDDEQLDWLDFKQVPTTIKTILKIGKELMEWAMTCKEATKIHKFFRGRGIDRDTVSRWRKRVPEFNRMFRFSLMAIGDRREDGAYDKKKSESIVLNTMGVYDPDYREYLAWKKSLDVKPEHEGKTLIVVTEPVPNSSLVPEKEK